MAARSANLSFEDLVGQSATVSFALGGGQTRYLNGIISRFVPGRHGRALHHLPRRAGALAVAPGSDHRRAHLPGADGARHRRADLLRSGVHRLPPGADQHVRQPRVLRAVSTRRRFDFVSRLLEDEGIWLLLPARGRQAHPGAGRRRLRPPGVPRPSPRRCSTSPPCPAKRARTPWPTAPTSSRWLGKYVVDDFNFETPSTDLVQEQEADGGRRERQRRLRVPRRLHPDTRRGSAGRGRAWRSHALRPSTLLRGEGRCPAFSAGHSFQLTGHERAAANTQCCCSG